MTARKSTSSTAPKKKKAAKKSAKQASKAKAKATPKKAAKKKAAAKAAKKESFSSAAVTLGHIFALRPRVDRSFQQSNLSEAKRNLASESYPTLADAARAVAEETLALTRESATRPDKRRR